MSGELVGQRWRVVREITCALKYSWLSWRVVLLNVSSTHPVEATEWSRHPRISTAGSIGTVYDMKAGFASFCSHCLRPAGTQGGHGNVRHPLEQPILGDFSSWYRRG